MIRLEESGLSRDGTRWRARPASPLKSPAIHPRPDTAYYRLGADRVEGYAWFEVEGLAVCLWEAELELVEGE